MEETKNFQITGTFVEVDGEKINIKDLPRDQYEYFLNCMHEVRIAYITIMSRRKAETPDS